MLNVNVNVNLTLRSVQIESNGPVITLSELQTHKGPFRNVHHLAGTPWDSLKDPWGSLDPIWEPWSYAVREGCSVQGKINMPLLSYGKYDYISMSIWFHFSLSKALTDEEGELL